MISEIQSSMAMQEEPERVQERPHDDEERESERESPQDEDAFDGRTDQSALEAIGRADRAGSAARPIGRSRQRSSLRPRPPAAVKLRMMMDEPEPR